MKHPRIVPTLLALIALGPFAALAQVSAPLDSATLAAFRWRSVGPANMSGRVTDVEGIGSPSKTFYVAAAAGGIWKTTNNGTTFRPLFTNERVISIGDIAIAPSDTNTIWAGTGEEDSRNSISPARLIHLYSLAPSKACSLSPTSWNHACGYQKPFSRPPASRNRWVYGSH